MLGASVILRTPSLLNSDEMIDTRRGTHAKTRLPMSSQQKTMMMSKALGTEPVANQL